MGSKKGGIYIPGNQLDTQQMTKSQFEGKGVSKAIPVEEGLLREATAVARSLLFVNYSGQDQVVEVGLNRLVNKGIGNELFNNIKIDELYLPAGQGTHFPVDPSHYTVSIGEQLVDSRGLKYQVTLLGQKYDTLINKSILIDPDYNNQGSYRMRHAKAKQLNFTEVFNNTESTLKIWVTRETVAYSLSEAELQLQRDSRDIDTGGRVIHDCIVHPNSKWVFKLTDIEFRIRVLEPVEIQDNFNCAPGMVYPLDTNYVEEGDTVMGAAQVCVVFANENENRGVETGVYNYNACKPVSATIAFTKSNVI